MVARSISIHIDVLLEGPNSLRNIHTQVQLEEVECDVMDAMEAISTHGASSC